MGYKQRYNMETINYLKYNDLDINKKINYKNRLKMYNTPMMSYSNNKMVHIKFLSTPFKNNLSE